MKVRTLDNREIEITEENAGCVLSKIDDGKLIPYLDNPYVKGIHGTRIFYTKDFYVAMYKRIHDEKMSYEEAYESLGFKVSELGLNRARQAGKNTMEKAKADKLFSVNPASYDGSIPLEQMPKLTQEEEIAQLKARVIYLEATNEIQKKIRSILAENYTSSKKKAGK